MQSYIQISLHSTPASKNPKTTRVIVPLQGGEVAWASVSMSPRTQFLLELHTDVCYAYTYKFFTSV